ncbi:MAG: formate/nitrite transporter family protein [Gammaproteobacteria bacterium]|nr:formate/nitrite transporter family protein [Gammaproteobacteria bacterium]
MDKSHFDLDAYTPAEVARRVEAVGVNKVGMPALQTLVLAVLAGAFIAFGAMLYTLVMTGAGGVSFGLHRWLGGLAFSLGLVLVVVAGAELFTGNNLIVMAWADKQVGHRALLRNWGLVYLGNLAGSVATALLYFWSGAAGLADGAVAETAIAIAAGKVGLPLTEAFCRGVLCNVLVCLAVWLCFAAHSVGDKILAILFPIAAFVALGFEHSVANMYLIPIGWLLSGGLDAQVPGLDLGGFLANLLAVTLGNVAGGGGLVALVYYLVYLRR